MDFRLKFNEDVLNYDKMRPKYVQELFNDVIQFSNLDNTKKALEIGIGTGQATLPFLNTGCKLTAIELGKDLAEFSGSKFLEYKDFNVINNDFENVDFNNNTYDLIYSATAFHWIPEQIGYQKVYQLLKSGGVLALFWNRPSLLQKDDLHIAIQEVYTNYTDFKEPVVPNEEKCLEIISTIEQYGFINANFKLYHQIRIFDAKNYISLLNTYSDHRSMQKDKRIFFEKELIKIINYFGGQIKLYDTMDLYLSRKP